MVLDSAGNLYGTTNIGGGKGKGTVFRLTPAGQQTVLYSFTDGADGRNPQAGVTLDSAGNLYGTSYGGHHKGGVVYKLAPTGQITVLHSFSSNTGSPGGAGPKSVTLDSAGNLYGTAEGGRTQLGVVYQLDPAGKEKVLYQFPGVTDGDTPQSGVVLDSAGNMYGTTPLGGTSAAGVVYKVDAAGQETVLYTFTGGTDGGNPSEGVILDSAGNLYGTASAGGAGYGVIYRVDTLGQETVLFPFSPASHARTPLGGVTLDSAGNLYGTTQLGGKSDNGTVYKLDATGTLTVLYQFTGGIDGGFPRAGVFLDSAGNLYGTTNFGGSNANAGAVYKLDTARRITVLHTFTGGTDGSDPSGVIIDPAGNLYGITSYGGVSGAGVVYKVDTAGFFSVLYSFKGGTDGGNPYGGVILDSLGNLYGTSMSGGEYGFGTVYKLDTNDNETVLYSFTGGADGGNPQAGVIFDAAGNLYGTGTEGGTANGAAGVLFKLTPQ
jgi:uncharacterized repeat protein (TIGR03803 family)